MDLTPSAPRPNGPSEGENPSLPSLKADLRNVTSLLFVLDRGHYADKISNLFAVAALYRAICLERRGEPELQVLGEVQVSNWARGFGTLDLFNQLHAGGTTLLVTSISMYRREFAQLAGTYQMSDSVLIGRPHLVPDSLPLGKRQDLQPPLFSLIEPLITTPGDEILQELLAYADCPSNLDPSFRTKLSQSLATLQTRTGLLAIREPGRSVDANEVLHGLIVDLASGSKHPTIFSTFGSEYVDALLVAESIWSDAREVSPGIFQLESTPSHERDTLVQTCLRKLYQTDPQARYVIERADDSAANALTPEEADSFSQRLTFGESSDDLLEEVKKLLADRGDTAAGVRIALGEDRGRDSTSIIKPILQDGRYIPDPNGCLTVIKSPDGFDVEALLEQIGVPMIDHRTFWLNDLQTGRAKRMTVSFQAQHLSAVLQALAE